MANLNVCSQKGLVEKFDSTIGASTVSCPLAENISLLLHKLWLQKFRFFTARLIPVH